jgi:SMI1 / KNR4 family (SUKH-1)/Ankyrin repeats (3 copies)
MQIRIVESNRFGTLNTAELEAFERRLGATLPDDYRRHLLQHNGGYVDGATRIGELHHVYGVHDGPEWTRFLDRAATRGIIPERLLPIANDPCGNQICVVLSGSDRGAVRFWDHEGGLEPDASVTQLAPDFDAYLRGVALKVAIARKQANVVRKAAQELGVHAPVYAGKTLLDLVFERGSLRLVKMLVAMGADIRPNALIEAVRNAAPNTVNYLLNRGANVNYAIPETGFTALMLAASRNTTAIAEVLLQHGADTTPCNRWGKTAAELAHSRRMIKLLQK